MKQFLIGMIIGWIVLPVIGLLYLRFGYVPVAVNGPVIPFEELLAGVKIYRDHCVECHGIPGAAASAISKGMFPAPPQFSIKK